MSSQKAVPHVLVLGGNFAGLGCAQKIREYAGDAVRISVVDRKSYLLKMRYREMFFMSHGKMVNWGLDAAEMMAETLS
jgi:hypothetical protein